MQSYSHDVSKHKNDIREGHLPPPLLKEPTFSEILISAFQTYAEIIGSFPQTGSPSPWQPLGDAPTMCHS